MSADMTEMTVGLVGTAEIKVTPETTAERFGNAGAAVFATPLLVALLEQAAINCIGPYLPAGKGTVGTRIEVEHLAATPIGMTVRATARLAEVAGKRLRFEVEAFDDREKVGQGLHERFIIDTERFLAKVNEKKR